MSELLRLHDNDTDITKEFNKLTTKNLYVIDVSTYEKKDSRTGKSMHYNSYEVRFLIGTDNKLVLDRQTRCSLVLYDRSVRLNSKFNNDFKFDIIKTAKYLLNVFSVVNIVMVPDKSMRSQHLHCKFFIKPKEFIKFLEENNLSCSDKFNNQINIDYENYTSKMNQSITINDLEKYLDVNSSIDITLSA